MSDEYIAGFFDGEGMIRLNKTNINGSTYYSLQCVVVNTDTKPLMLMRERYGGTISARKKYKDNWKIAYRWRLTANDAENFLLKMLPILIVKKEQAEIAIEFQNHIHKKKWGNRYGKMPQSEIEIRDSFFERITKAKGRLPE